MNKLIKICIIVVTLVLVTPSTAQGLANSSVTVISPNGGESYTVGGTLSVSWTTVGSVAKVGVNLLGYDSSLPMNPNPTQLAEHLCLAVNLTTVNIPNTGQFNYVITEQTGKNNQNQLCAYYKIQVADENLFTTGISDNSDGLFTISASQSDTAHVDGTNILGTDGTVYRIVNSTRRPYTSAGAFLSYKFNSWSTLVIANTADMNLPTSSFIPPRDGSLINDKGTIYLITSADRVGFSNETAFKNFGYSYTYVSNGDTSFLSALGPINTANQKHYNGTLVNDNGTIYVMKFGQRWGFPSPEVLSSWGYSFSDAVTANSFDRESEIGGVVQARTVNQLRI